MKIITNTAMSLDGKISTANTATPFLGSENDKRKLKLIRNIVDATITGGNTFRSWPYPNLPENQKNKIWNIIVSHTLNLDFNTDFLSEARINRLVMTDQPNIPKNFPVEVYSSVNQLTPMIIVNELKNRGINTLLIEGGGELIFSFLKENLIDEMYVTICPKIIGGQNAPTIVGGKGFDINEFKYLEILDQETIGNEIFLHYKVIK